MASQSILLRSGLGTKMSPSTLLAASRSLPTLPYPRAAVAVTVQSKAADSTFRYLLVKRANPPDQGKWSLPGGKIHIGEQTLSAAQRELLEETQLSTCRWHTHPFMTTDAITRSVSTGEVEYHYLIAQCFAQANDGLPQATPSDDALDAQWFSWPQMKTMQEDDSISKFVVDVVGRAEELSLKGMFF